MCRDLTEDAFLFEEVIDRHTYEDRMRRFNAEYRLNAEYRRLQTQMAEAQRQGGI